MSPFEARRLEVRDCVTGDTETKFVIRTRRHSSWRTKGVRAHNRKPECPALIGMHKGKSCEAAGRPIGFVWPPILSPISTSFLECEPEAFYSKESERRANEIRVRLMESDASRDLRV